MLLLRRVHPVLRRGFYISLPHTPAVKDAGDAVVGGHRRRAEVVIMKVLEIKGEESRSDAAQEDVTVVVSDRLI